METPIELDRKDPKSPYFTPEPKLSPSLLMERSFDLMRLYQIAQVRESPWPQFDGMGYMKYNETNEMADISFLPPKKNKGDTRITTGVTHEKDSTLVAFYLNLNFEGNVRVFKGEQELYDFGTAITKLVRKSREIEEYDNKRANNYRNYTVQGTSFALERFTEVWVPNKIITGDVNPARLDLVKWTEAGLKKQKAFCESVLVDGKKVFLENIREPDIQKQPRVYTVEYISRPLLKSMWGETKMWEYVPYLTGSLGPGSLTQGSIYSEWIWGEVDYTKVEVVTVYDRFNQRYQIYFNGVPMLPANFPLTAVSPSGLIPIAKGDGDLMNMFAYSKSDPAKLKIDQAVFDELLQNMVMMSRQGARVPRANNTGRILTPEMFLGGRLITNLDPNDVPPLVENPGIKQFDFSFYELFKQHLDEKSLSSLLQGGAPGGDVTLGQYMEQTRKAMLSIGGRLDGLIQWEKQLLKLRVFNLLANGAQKNDDGTYKDISMEDSMFDGSKGLNVMKFTENNILSPYQILDQENQFKQEQGTDVEYTYLDPVQMKAILNDPSYYFCFEVVPVDKNNDKLTQLMFVNMVQQAQALFGPDSLQVRNLKRRYAQIMGETYDDIFASDEEVQMKQMQAMQMQEAEQKPINQPDAIVQRQKIKQAAEEMRV